MRHGFRVCWLCQHGDTMMESLHEYTRRMLSAVYTPTRKDLEAKQRLPFTLVGTCPEQWMWFPMPFFVELRWVLVMSRAPP